MAIKLGLTEHEQRVLTNILQADGSDFTTMVAVAGLDPAVDFKAADLRGVDFGQSDLSGFDFSDADLSGCRLDRAKLAGAIFANNRSTGTVWPLPASDPLPFRPALRSIESYNLGPPQQKAIDAVIAGLERGIARPVVVMPPGTGRTKVLESILEELDHVGRLGTVLVFGASQSATVQLTHQLSHAFGVDAVSNPYEKRAMPRPEHRLIMNSILSLRSTGAGRPNQTIHTYPDVSHIFIVDGSRMSVGATSLEMQYPGVPIVRFIGSDLERLRDQRNLFEDNDVVFVLTYRDAVKEGMLEPVELRSRSTDGALDYSDPNKMERLVHDIAEDLQDMSPGAVGGIVCRNIDAVRKLARELNRVNILQPGLPGVRRIVQHTATSADESLVRAALDMPGTLLIMTELVAADFDWSVMDYAIVLTRLRSPEELAFVRRRPRSKQPLRVFDYVQTLTRSY